MYKSYLLKFTKYYLEKLKKIQRNRDIAYSWVRSPYIVKMSILLHLNYKFNMIAIKIPAHFLIGDDGGKREIPRMHTLERQGSNKAAPTALVGVSAAHSSPHLSHQSFCGGDADRADFRG